MAATPPHQITFAPDTPATPRHGPMYDDTSPNTRSSERLKQKRAIDSARDLQYSRQRARQSEKTYKFHKDSLFQPRANTHSPDSTPKRKTARRVEIRSPVSPNTQFIEPQSSNIDVSRLRPFESGTVSLGEGMLPTPVKTPKKKQAPKSNLAGRALFQDVTSRSELSQSPRKARKSRRYNGFSLESFRANDNAEEGQIQIFTDSRDQVPEADKTTENPFLQQDQYSSRPERVSGTAKRRKISEKRPRDAQVEEAIRNDEGMVYVFRGKKVFRRFDDTGEEEEEIDPTDLGLLESTISSSGDRKRFKTLTRKSIKPTRLFQTDEQKRLREAEREEEAVTDIDDTVLENNHKLSAGKSAETAPAVDKYSSTFDKSEHDDTASSKKQSPFDAWPRSKSASSKRPRGLKRAHVEEHDSGLLQPGHAMN